MNKSLLSFCCLTGIVLCEAPESEQPTVQKINVEQRIYQTIVNQKTSLDIQPLHLFGKKLNAHLNNLDTKAFKEFFVKLPLRAKVMYMLTMTIGQYEAFLERYTDEEWTNFWHSSNMEDQEHLPKTRTEQLLLIRDAYYAYMHKHSSILFSYYHPKAPYPSDLGTFKKLFHKDECLPTQFDDMHVFINSAKKEYIDAYMLRKRCELFNL